MDKSPANGHRRRLAITRRSHQGVVDTRLMGHLADMAYRNSVLRRPRAVAVGSILSSVLRRGVDGGLMLLFAAAAFVALVYEPGFLLDCGWAGLHQGAAGPCADTWIDRAWLGYLKIEPIYADAPLWLQLVNELDSLLFGWFYLLSVLIFIRGQQDRRWYRYLGTFTAGMMVYAMVLYLSWEALSHRQTGANFGAVLGYNGLWLLTFALLLLRLHLPILRDESRYVHYAW